MQLQGILFVSAVALCPHPTPATPPVAAPGGSGPDLVVESIDTSSTTGDWQTLMIGGTVAVGVRNIGDAPTGAPCQLALYEDANDNDVYDPGTDTLLGASFVGPLGPGALSLLNVNVVGQVTFRDNLIHVTVDAADEIAESDETNNTRDSGQFCELPPEPPGPIDPVLEWSWTSSAVQPSALNVMMTPAVVDLTMDGIPDVVFGSTASTGGGLVEAGYLRALNGDDGTEIFTVDDPALIISTTFSVAVGDIDGDGEPEIVCAAVSNNRLYCFEADGTLKWASSVVEALNWGGASIADIDQDGTPEIVVGRQALDASGTLLWTGVGSRGSIGTAGALSMIADLDGNGVPDVSAGPTAYRNDGTILWNNAGIPDGHGAIGNFDADPLPEIVHVSGGTVRLLSGESGAVQWGPVVIPGGGTGGPPTVADYDDDGMPEIGVAGANRYAVFEDDGTLKWSAVTQDGSSNRTGSSVFDFNGDGSAEVVYRDELFLRIYRGTDGFVLWSTPLSSCTWHEYVLVADVDADGNAEIVAVANNNCGFGPQRGVFVYGAADDSWVPTRRVWNQHTYHITNVDEDGGIPQFEDDNWLTPSGDPLNNYRQNTLNGLSPTATPDLTASFLSAAPGLVTGRIGNGGAVLVAAGIPVSFYDGDPGGGGVLLGTTATSVPLEPGEFEDVSLAVGALPAEVYVSADDLGGLIGTENECDETNNVHGRSLSIPFFTSPVCGQTLAASVGVPLSYVISAEDLDAFDVLTLDATGTPAGATHTPVLPTTGNPVSTQFDWTPQNGDVGATCITYTATDGAFTVECKVTIVVAECHLIVAASQGSDLFTSGGYVYTTQLAGIDTSYPVLMDDLPAFPAPRRARRSKRARSLDATVVEEFQVQVVMYNPEVFPLNPEQSSNGLSVFRWSDGTLSTRPYGTNDGIHLWFEEFTGADGRRYYRFPFAIDGL